MMLLNKEQNIKLVFQYGLIDFFNCFVGFSWSDSFEEFYCYYMEKIVDVQVDVIVLIVMFNIYVFDVKFVWNINKCLLDLSE